MKNLLCVIGRHDWKVKHDKEGRPYEICLRPQCYRLRNDDARSDGPYTHTDPGRPPPPQPPDPGAGAETEWETSSPLRF
jgi:hypothetical protein